MKDNKIKTILSKGDIINETYEIQAFIGEGAFGQVYRVKHKFLGLQVIKVLKEEFSNKIDIEVISKEAKILSKLTDHNIVRVFESNTFFKADKEYFFISMGFISGEPLSKLLKRENQLSVSKALNFQLDILSGLMNAHNRKSPIIHRDISPDNVLISYDNEKPMALLSDFGLACTFNKLSQIPDAAGKYIYLAPECFWDIYLPASDVFSAGIVFYKMLSGIYPWKYNFDKFSENHEKIKTMILSARKKEIKPPSAFNDCDDRLDKIVLKSLSLEIKDRYKNANEFFNALLDYKNNLSTNISKIKKTPRKENVNLSGFGKVAGMNDLKEILQEDVINPLKEKELYEEYKVSVLNGILLYGPPGCGKTFIARSLAEEVGFNFIEVKPSDIASKFIHGTQEKIKELFDNAREKSPSIIFIDEIDAMLPSREGNIDHSYASEVNEFLAQMTECQKDDIFVIAATNRPEKIDAAILRTGRIDKIIYVPPPDFEARKEMFELYLRDRPTNDSIVSKNIAQMTEYYVSSDIKYIVEVASKMALKKREKINQFHLETAIEKSKPSVSERQLNKYEKFKDRRNFI